MKYILKISASFTLLNILLMRTTENICLNCYTFNRVTNFTANSAGETGYIIFRYVSLKEQELVLFNGDLSKVSFAGTNITSPIWRSSSMRKCNVSSSYKSQQADNDNRKSNKEKIDFKIFDERIIVYGGIASLESVIAEYRNLRENYEYNLRYEEAGQFFIREMELRRKYKQTSSAEGMKIKEKNIFERIFNFAALYYLISDYGESTRKPLAITVSVFSIATLYFWYLKGWSMDVETVSDSIRRTLRAFILFLTYQIIQAY